MPTHSNSGRRRKHQRFSVRGSALVILQRPPVIGFGKPRLVELGPVIDIGLGGVGVQYLEHKKRVLDADLLTIAAAGDAFRIENLPFRVVADNVLATLPGGRNIHRCCIEFIQLPAYQRFQLERFIKGYTYSASQVE